jgi:hypothetical protein
LRRTESRVRARCCVARRHPSHAACPAVSWTADGRALLCCDSDGGLSLSPSPAAPSEGSVAWHARAETEQARSPGLRPFLASHLCADARCSWRLRLRRRLHRCTALSRGAPLAHSRPLPGAASLAAAATAAPRAAAAPRLAPAQRRRRRPQSAPHARSRRRRARLGRGALRDGHRRAHGGRRGSRRQVRLARGCCIAASLALRAGRAANLGIDAL